MKVIGIQIEGEEAILVVLNRDNNGVITQTNECVKLNIPDHLNSTQVQQFRDQVNSAFDLINPSYIGIKARNAKAASSRVRPPSPISFKLEGIIQLYPKCDIEFIWPATLSAFKKSCAELPTPKKKYQQDAYEVAYYLLNK